MSNLKETLRAMHREEYGDLPGYCRDTCEEAADRIETLERALGEAVRYIEGHRDMPVGIRERLQEALSP